MDPEEFIDALAEGGSNDQEIEGLKMAFRAAVDLLTTELHLRLYEKLPEILQEAQSTTY